MNSPKIDGPTLSGLTRYSLDRVAVLGSKAIVSTVAIGLLVAMSL